MKNYFSNRVLRKIVAVSVLAIAIGCCSWHKQKAVMLKWMPLLAA